VADLDAPLVEQFLGVAPLQRKVVVQPHGMLKDGD